MYIKVLFNIKKMKKMGGGGNSEPKTLSMYLKKNVTEPGLEPTTSGLEIY